MKSHYVSVPLSEACRNDLNEVQTALASDAKELKLRPSGVEFCHLTLGVYKISKSRQDETEKELTKSVNKILTDFLDKRPPLELTFGNLGNFGSRIVFIYVMNVKQLEALRQDMNELLEKEGIYLADKKFTPHVTILRGNNNGRGRHGRYGRDIGSTTSKVTLGDMVRRTDLPSVASSPVKQIVLKKLQRY